MWNGVKREEEDLDVEEHSTGSVKNLKRKREKKEKKKRKSSDDTDKKKKKKKKKRYSVGDEDSEDGKKYDELDSHAISHIDKNGCDINMSETEIETSIARQNGAQHPHDAIIQVEVAETLDPTKAPIVVSFPGGCMTDASLPITFHSFQRTPHSTRGVHLRGTDDKCTYISSNLGRGYDYRKTKTLVGVYNVQQRKLVLHLAAEKGTVFPMQQYVSGINSSTTANDNQNLTWEARKNELYEAFGSTKKQKYLKSAAANKVDVNAVVGSNSPAILLDTGVANKQQNTTIQENQPASTSQFSIDPVEEALEESRLQLLPRFDKSAILPCQVYNAHSIAGEEAWNQISRVVDACIGKGNDGWANALLHGRRPVAATKYANKNMDNAETSTNTRIQWPASLVRLIDSLNDEKYINDKKVKHRVKVILLLRHVMKLHSYANKRQFHQGTAEEVAKFLGIPKEVSDRLLTIFATPMEHSISGKAGFAFTKQLKDKRTVHALLLYMMAHGDSMMVSSMKLFLSDMELNLNLASKLLNEAGCTVKKNTESNDISVALTVPLQFPRSKGTKGGGSGGMR